MPACPPTCTNGSFDVTSSSTSSSLSSCRRSRASSRTRELRRREQPARARRRIAAARRLQVHAQVARRAQPLRRQQHRDLVLVESRHHVAQEEPHLIRIELDLRRLALVEHDPALRHSGSTFASPRINALARIARSHEREHLVAAVAPEKRRGQRQRRIVGRLQPRLQRQARRPRARRDGTRASTAT